MSASRCPKYPLIATNTVSSGSTTFANVASIAALPVPLIGSVNRLLVCQAYLSNS